MQQVLNEADKILMELRRRWRERELTRYVPNVKQQSFHATEAPIKLYVGANGTGKTTCIVAECSGRALGFLPWCGVQTRNPPVSVAIACQDFTHAAVDDLTPKIERFLPSSRVVKRDRLANGRIHKWHLDNGSSVGLFSYEMDPFAYEGLDFDCFAFNEPPPRSIYVPVMRGVQKKDGIVMFAMTPIGGESAWIYDELYTVAGSDPEIFQVTATHDDMFMSDKAKARFYNSLNEDEREARWDGKFRHLVGLIYKDYDSGIHCIKGGRMAQLQEWIKSPEIPKGLVVDPHDRRPFAMAWFLINPKGHVIFFREWPVDPHHSWKSCSYSVNDYAKFIADAEKEMGFEPVWRLMDPNYGVAKRSVTGESIVDRFASLGLYFDTEIHDGIEDGHLAVKEMMAWNKNAPAAEGNCPRLYITGDCWNLEYALTHYTWSDPATDSGKPAREKPGENGKDFADLLRYVAVANLGYWNPMSLALSKKPERRFRGLL